MNLKRIFLLGDIGLFNLNLNSIVHSIQTSILPNDIIVLLGDNFYPNGIHSSEDNQILKFQKTFKNISNPIYSILGNHDYLQNPQAQINNSNWIMPDFYYKKEFNNIDLYFLDTVQFDTHSCLSKELIENVHNNTINNIINKQLTWLDNEMEKNKEKPKIVFGHYPIISNGLYINHVNSNFYYLFYLLKKYNVQAYISGHEHNIQHITRIMDNYKLNQIIIGSSAECRNDFDFSKYPDMYDNFDNYFGKLLIDDTIQIEYINKNNITNYVYDL